MVDALDRHMKAKQLLILCLTSNAACYSEQARNDRAAKVVEDPRDPPISKPQVEPLREVQEGRVSSKDGTAIAFEKAGNGPVLVVVGGALSHRELARGDALVPELAKHFTVYTYDRRGRGGSTDVKPYAVERELEDIEALVDHAGSAVALYGVSSGAALALQAAAKLGPSKVSRLALYEPPYGQDGKAFAEQKRQVERLVKTGAPGDAAEYFLGAIGMPRGALQDLKRSAKWQAIEKIDFTLVYDFAVLGDGAVPRDVALAVRVPTLVMNGGNSLPFMRPTADAIGRLVPLAERMTLANQTHQADGKVVAPILIEFFTRPNRNS